MTRLSLAIAALPLLIAACGGGGGGGNDEDDGGTSTGGPTTDDDDTSPSTSGVDETGDESETGDTEADGVEVEILRDEHGVPHIRAATDEAAFYGLGYAVAEDRLLQMTVGAYIVTGRFSEIVGSEGIANDMQMRVWGMARHAEKAVAAMDPEYVALLDAYSAGVNAYVAENDVDPLFEQLGMPPMTWTPALCLASWYRVANFFTGDPSAKAVAYEEFLALEEQVGTQAAIDQTIGDPHPGDPSKGVVQAQDVPDEVEQAIYDYAESLGYGNEMKGVPPIGYAASQPNSYSHKTPKFSHAWAVSGDMTTTGKSVLISDPQVQVTSPNLLHEFAIDGETVHARGAGAPGSPGLLIGFTPQVAWGMTAAGLDQRDLFALEMVGEDQYVIDGVTYDIESQDETIEVKGGPAQTVAYRESVWGPVITEILDSGRETEYAMKGTPFAEPDRETFTAMVDMMRATDLESFRDAIEEWRFPSANLIVAAEDGHVFYTLVGAIPVRSTASPLGGMIAQPGGSAIYDWLDTIPGQYKPWVVDPGVGYVMSANHRPTGDWYPLKLAVGQGGGGDGIRSRRLRENLEALPAQSTPQDILTDTQWDCVNGSKRDLVAIGRQIAQQDPTALSQNSHDLLDALVAWSDSGGSMITLNEGVYMANQLNTKFRIQQTGPELNTQFGGGENGLNLFLDTMMGSIANDPSYLPDTYTIAYIDDLLDQTWAGSTGHGQGAQQEQLYADSVATMTLGFLVGPDFDLGTSESYETPVLPCADGQTIWSQKGETYTQFVDLDAIDSSSSVLPVGGPEGTSEGLGTSQVQLWADGELKPAPISLEAIDAIVEDSKTLQYVPQ